MIKSVVKPVAFFIGCLGIFFFLPMFVSTVAILGECMALSGVWLLREQMFMVPYYDKHEEWWPEWYKEGEE